MSTPLLVLKDVRFRWPAGQQDVLSLEHFELKQGEKVFLKGPSGSGKTTLLSLIGGILKPQQGAIELLGQDLVTFSQSQRDRHRAAHIGYIFQQFNLIPYLSVIDNIVLACQFSPERSAKALTHARSLADEAMRLLGHLELDDEALLSRPVQDLSIGQQQRVAAARALIGSPELIIADEPTSALDHDTRERFIQLLMQECDAAGSGLIFVSHDASLESSFERTLHLNQMNRVSEGETG